MLVTHMNTAAMHIRSIPTSIQAVTQVPVLAVLRHWERWQQRQKQHGHGRMLMLWVSVGVRLLG
jgi:hypothetical protein